MLYTEYFEKPTLLKVTTTTLKRVEAIVMEKVNTILIKMMEAMTVPVRIMAYAPRMRVTAKTP